LYAWKKLGKAIESLLNRGLLTGLLDPDGSLKSIAFDTIDKLFKKTSL
jgi:hypothetical protein